MEETKKTTHDDTKNCHHVVQFEAEGWYLPVKSQKDMTLEEKSAIWYQREDYRTFQDGMAQELQFKLLDRELQQQREEYEQKLMDIKRDHKAQIAALEKSKNIEICRLKAAKRQAQAQAQPNIQALIYKQELLQQRDYYEELVENLECDNQKLRKAIHNMEKEKDELTDVIRAREVDRARNEVCSLQARLAEQSQRNDVAANQIAAKDEALSKAQQEIAELRWKLTAQAKMMRATRCPSPGPVPGSAGSRVSTRAGATTVVGRTA